MRLDDGAADRQPHAHAAVFLARKRVKNLLQLILNQSFGQVFITDTHKDRLEAAFVNLQTNYQVIEL